MYNLVNKITNYLANYMATLFDSYVDIIEASRILGVHPNTVRRLIQQGHLPSVQFAGKYLIERDKLEMFNATYDSRPGSKAYRRLL